MVFLNETAQSYRLSNKKNDSLFRSYGTLVLEVPYAEKDEAKDLGAKWNPIIKKWIVELKSTNDREKFARWFPDKSDDLITLLPQLYLLKSYENCYRCKSLAEVFCLAADGLIDPSEEYYDHHSRFDMFFTISSLASVPDDIDLFLKKNTPRYYRDYTRESNSYYHLNHCQCGAKLGDFYLHNEPGGAFYPLSEESAYNDITKYLIYSSVPIKVDAAYSLRCPDFIKTHSKLDYSLKLDS